MKRVSIALLVGAMLIVATGCGGRDSSSSDSGGQADKPASGSGKADVTVDMKDIEFKPKTVTVKKGRTIRWTNSDAVPHDVTKDSGPGPNFASDTIDPGGDYEHKFDTSGTIPYVCTIHPNMTGTIKVTP